MPTTLQKLAVEFIGTFFLVLTVGLTALKTPAGVIPPIAIGAVLIAMVYAGGYISGAQYNPAVTFGVWVRGLMKLSDVLGYIAAQLLAALLAAAVVWFFKAGPAPVADAGPLAPLFLAEFLFTFALVWVVLNVATAEGTKGHSFYGLAIGLTVMAGAFAVGPISGGAFNPAVVLGAAILGLLNPAAIWIFVLANLAGGAAAGLAFRFVDQRAAR